MNKTSVILTVLVIYKIVLIAVGLWAQRRSSNSEDFLIGDRQLGALVAAISYSASSSSAWTLLGVSGIAFSLGLSAIWFVLGSIIGMLVSWTFIAPKLMQLSHEHRLVTLTDILVLNIKGPWRKPIIVFASFIIVCLFWFYVAAQLQGAGQTFNQAFGVDPNRSIMIGAVIILIYTLLGGFWAVSVTDTLQGMLMFLAALIIPIAAYIKLGGFSGFWTSYQNIATTTQLSWLNSQSGLIALGFVVATFGVSLGTFGQPHLLVRFMALRDKTALRRARLITVTWFTIVFGGMFFLGLAGRVLLSELSNPEAVFIAMSELLFSPIIAGIIIAALLSAIMSTADSQLLAGAAAISHDLGLNKYFKGHEILVTRIAITLMLLASCLIAVNIPATIFKRALLAWSALGAAFGPLIICRVIGLKVSGRACFFAIVLGFSTAAWFHFNPETLSAFNLGSGPIHERVSSFFIGLIILVSSHCLSVKKQLKT